MGDGVGDVASVTVPVWSATVSVMLVTTVTSAMESLGMASGTSGTAS